nr:MAG TPA_asm: hypothetical protein [Caudoviricetes sp.]
MIPQSPSRLTDKTEEGAINIGYDAPELLTCNAYRERT